MIPSQTYLVQEFISGLDMPLLSNLRFSSTPAKYVMAKKGIKTSSAKAKGRKLQQVVRDAVLSLFPHLTPDDVRSCPMGSNGTDLMLSSQAQRDFPYSVECKARAKIALIYDAYEQAKSQSRTLEPLVVVKADRKRPLVVMDMDHFIDLLKK